MLGGSRGVDDIDRTADRGEFAGLEELEREPLRLGQELRFLLVAVGGGGVRIGREIARHHPRYLETIAINCDPSVQQLDEFDRRITLEPRDGEALEGPGEAGFLARSAEPALERIFEGAVFVTVVGTLGGNAGTGLLPSVVEAAARSAVFVSVFAVKPFAIEQERRGLADRTLARLHFVEPFVDKQQRQAGRLQVLDNEVLARQHPTMPIAGVTRHWAELVEQFMDHTFLKPAEAAVEELRIARMVEAGPMNRVPEATQVPLPDAGGRGPALPFDPGFLPAAAPGSLGSLGDAELTFEIDPPGGPRGPG